MFVSHQHKVIAVSVPKTGSTTMHYALMNNLKVPFHTQSTAPAIYHMTANDLRMVMGAEAFGAYYSFGVVRNPYDRLVSLYHDFHDQRGMIRAASFTSFVRHGLTRWLDDVHFRPQTFFLCDAEGKCIPSQIFRFEDGMGAVINRVGDRLGLTPKPIGHARRSERKDWQSYFNRPDLRAIIQDVYADDFATFGYSVECEASQTRL